MSQPTRTRDVRKAFGFAVVGLGTFAMTASSAAPSPLYPVYQQLWGFSAALLTVVFAVYVLALLVMLLTVGSLSDRIGRRPVVATALLVLAASMVVFIAADDVAWLIAARVLQGVAVGAATGALAAAVIDLQPNPRIGPLVNSIGPSLGLALGAAGAGLLVEFAPFPTVLSYALIAGLAVTLAVALIFVPETSRSTGFASAGEALRSLVPSVSVPREVRGPLLLIVPCLMSAWALGGLYMSLGPSIVASVFGIDDRLVAGLAIATLFASGTVAAVVMTGRAPRRIVLTGVAVLSSGVVLVVWGVLAGSVGLYFAATAVAGFGWGAVFLGSMNVIGGMGRPHDRGRIFATMYIVCYLAFSVPAMLAGVATGMFGLTATVVGYGAGVAALASISGVAVLVRGPKPRPVHLEEVPVPPRGGNGHPGVRTES